MILVAVIRARALLDTGGRQILRWWWWWRRSWRGSRHLHASICWQSHGPRSCRIPYYTASTLRWYPPIPLFFNPQLCITLPFHARLFPPFTFLDVCQCPKMDSPILYIADSLQVPCWCTIGSMEGLAYSDGWEGRRIRGLQQQHPSFW